MRGDVLHRGSHKTGLILIAPSAPSAALAALGPGHVPAPTACWLAALRALPGKVDPLLQADCTLDSLVNEGRLTLLQSCLSAALLGGCALLRDVGQLLLCEPGGRVDLHCNLWRLVHAKPCMTKGVVISWTCLAAILFEGAVQILINLLLENLFGWLWFRLVDPDDGCCVRVQPKEGPGNSC